MSTPSRTPAIPPLAFDRVAAFIRLITHDVRNGLNAIDLQSAYLSEIAGEPEVREELGKLREIVGNVTRSMQALSSSFAEVRPSLLNYPARELASAFQEKAAKDHGQAIEWNLSLEGEEIELDFNLLTFALQELVNNASHFREGEGPIRFSARREGEQIVFEVAQPGPQPAGDPQQWGREPLASTRRGAYGLGLFYVRRILDVLGGTWEARHEGGETKVRLSFPVTAGGPVA